MTGIESRSYILSEAAEMSGADTWTVAGKTVHSRLIVGTGKSKDYEVIAAAADWAGGWSLTQVSQPAHRAAPHTAIHGEICQP